MNYSNIGPITISGISEQSVMGSTPGEDYIGFKNYVVTDLGYLGAGLVSGITSGQNTLNVQVKLGANIMISPLFEVGASKRFEVRWRAQVTVITSNTATVKIVGSWHVEEGDFGLFASDVIGVDLTASQGSNFLPDYNMTLINSENVTTIVDEVIL